MKFIAIPDCHEMTSLLRPGHSSSVGFLDHKESLDSVLSEDDHMLEKLGVTHKQISDRLVTLIEKRKWLLHKASITGDCSFCDNRDILVEGKYKMGSCHWLGYQDCPICSFLKIKAGREALSDCDYTIECDGGSFTFSELIPHLVGGHHFFEGHTKHRLDPLVVVKALGIVKGQDYSPKWEEEKRWYKGASSSSIPPRPVLMENIWSDYRPLFRLRPRRLDAHTSIYQKGDKVLVVWNNPDEGHFSDRNSVAMVDGIPLVYSAWVGSGWSSYEKKTCRFVKDVPIV